MNLQRLFVGEPIWTPYNRDEIDELKNESRQKYVENFLKPLQPASKKAKTEVEETESKSESVTVSTDV